MSGNSKMSKPVPYLNEIVSLTVMLLMIIALVAGQADATAHEALREATVVPEAAEAPFHATIRADIDGMPLTISIDASAEFEYFRLEDE